MNQRASRGVWYFIAFLVSGLFLLAGGLFYNNGKPPLPRADEIPPLTLGLARPMDAMIHLTERLGHFTAQGLTIRLEHLPAGKKVMEGVLDGRLDMGVVGLGPIAFAAFERQDFKILASLSTYYDLYKIIARKNAGIQSSEDLRGKRIATTGESSLHFFLHNFLVSRLIPPEEVHPVFVEDLRTLPDLLQRGEVDAIVAREPVLGQTMALLGDNGLMLESPELPANIFSLVARDTFLIDHAPQIRLLLRALTQTVDAIERHPAEMRALLQQVNADVEQEPTPIPGRPEHFLTLDQDLLMRLEAIARWNLRNHGDSNQSPPNFMTILEPKFLREVRPMAVTLIH